MKNFTLGNWQVNKEIGELTNLQTKQIITLEPLLMNLLCFLAERQDAVVSRNDLAEAMWPNVIVEDNTISKAITRLRKVLGDDVRAPTYIKTVSKRGYRLIAHVSYTTTITSAVNAQQRTTTAWRNALIVVLLLLLTGLYLKDSPPVNTQHAAAQFDSQALTSRTGRDYNATLSHDARLLSFVGNSESGVRLFITDLDTQQLSAVAELGDSTAYPRWSSSGYSLLWSEINNDSCQIKLLPDARTLTLPAQTILQCTQFDNPIQPEWDHSGQGFYFVGQLQQTASLFHFDLRQQQLSTIAIHLSADSKLAKPSPDGKLIAVLHSAEDTSRISIVDKNHLTIKHSIDISHLLENVEWSANSTALLFAGAHPSNKLYQYNLKHQQQQLLTSTEFGYLEQVNAVSQSGDIIITSSYIDLDLVSINNGKARVIEDSSYPDYLGQYNHSRTQLAFASKRTGMAQVWLQRADGNSTQLSQFQQAYYLYSLHWSPDDSRLLVKANEHIYWFDIANRKQHVLALPKLKIKTPHWYSNDILYFIGDNGTSEQLYRHQLSTGDTEAVFLHAEKLQIVAGTLYLQTPQTDLLLQFDAAGVEPVATQYNVANTLDWRINDKQLYVTYPHKSGIWLQPTQGEARQIYDGKILNFNQFQLLSEQNYLLTQTTTNEANIIRLSPHRDALK